MSAVDLVEVLNEANNGRLPSTRWSNQSHDLPWLDMEADILKQRNEH